MTYNRNSTFPTMFRLLMHGAGGDKKKHNTFKQAELAEYCDVSDCTISRWANGKGSPKLTDIYKIAEFFKVPVSMLVEPLDAAEPTEQEKVKIEVLRCIARDGNDC